MNDKLWKLEINERTGECTVYKKQKYAFIFSSWVSLMKFTTSNEAKKYIDSFKEDKIDIIYYDIYGKEIIDYERNGKEIIDYGW